MKNEFTFLVYRSALEDVTVDAIIKDETIWLTQKSMAELFGVQTPAISKHLKNIFEEGELDEKVVVSKMEITTAAKAGAEYIEYNKTQRIVSDFDREVKRLMEGGEKNE